jgi:hypothetical protein
VSDDYRDLVITELADSEAALREEIRTLVDLIADLAWANHWLRVVADRAFRHPYQTRARDRERHDDHTGAAA